MKFEQNETGKKLAVITGASSGIGYALARQFAKNGFDLLVTAENPEINQAAEAFRETGVEVHSIQVDLAEYQGVEDLYSKIKQIGRPVDALALNAGVGVGGASFEKSDLQAEIKLINLNVVSYVHLTKLVLKDMLQRENGRILFTSSVASTMPGPYYSVYAASKAFIQSFAEAVREEVKDKGVSITALMPGATETNFFARAGMEDTKAGEGAKDDPAQVAKQGFDALMAGKAHVVAGAFKNKIRTTVAKVIPEVLAAKAQGKATKPNSPLNR